MGSKNNYKTSGLADRGGMPAEKELLTRWILRDIFNHYIVENQDKNETLHYWLIRDIYHQYYIPNQDSGLAGLVLKASKIH